MTETKKQWKNVGSIRESKKGKLYIMLDDVSTLTDGIALQIEKPEVKLRRLHELGYLTDDQLEERLEKVPKFIKYEISQPPEND